MFCDVGCIIWVDEISNKNIRKVCKNKISFEFNLGFILKF